MASSKFKYGADADKETERWIRSYWAAFCHTDIQGFSHTIHSPVGSSNVNLLRPNYRDQMVAHTADSGAPFPNPQIDLKNPSYHVMGIGWLIYNFRDRLQEHGNDPDTGAVNGHAAREAYEGLQRPEVSAQMVDVRDNSDPNSRSYKIATAVLAAIQQARVPNHVYTNRGATTQLGFSWRTAWHTIITQMDAFDQAHGTPSV